MEENAQLALRYEIARKAIHLSSISIPLIYWFISRDLALLLLTPLFAGFVIIDLLKNVVQPISRWYHRTFDAMLRSHELNEEKFTFNGATYMVLSALLLVLFFPKVIAVTAFAMVAISDTMAAIVGRTLGRHRFGHKSIEGSVAFLLSALVIVTVVPGIPAIIGIAMAITATIAEAIAGQVSHLKIDDNLVIPLTSASVGLLLYGWL